MYWLPGHPDIHKSTEVDRFAQLATQTGTHTHSMTYQHLQIEGRNTIIKKWQGTWGNLTQNKHRELKHTVRKWQFCWRTVKLSHLRIVHSRLTHS